MKRIILLILLLSFSACLKNPTGTFQNTKFSSDTIILEKLDGTQYKMTRGYLLPGTGEMKNPAETTVKIEGNIMNYRGKNYNAFSNNFDLLTFKDGTFKRVK